MTKEKKTTNPELTSPKPFAKQAWRKPQLVELPIGNTESGQGTQQEGNFDGEVIGDLS